MRRTHLNKVGVVLNVDVVVERVLRAYNTENVSKIERKINHLRVAHQAVGQITVIAQKAADEARLALRLGVVVVDRHEATSAL